MTIHRTNIVYRPANFRAMAGAAFIVGLGILVAAGPAGADTFALGVSASVSGAPQGNSEALYASQNLAGENAVNGCSVGLCVLLGDPTAAITTSPGTSAAGILSYAFNLSSVGSNASAGGSLASGSTGISMVSGSGSGGSTETTLGAGVIMEDGLTFHFAGGGTQDIGVGLSLNGSINVPVDGSYVQSILMGLGTAQFQWGASFVNANGGTPVSEVLPGTENWVSTNTPVQTPASLDFNGVLSVTSGQDLQFFLQQQMNCNVGATCDFGDPLQISLSLPAGVTFSSDSGVFLSASQQASPVPETSTLTMLGTCLLALGLNRWRKRMAAK